MASREVLKVEWSVQGLVFGSNKPERGPGSSQANGNTLEDGDKNWAKLDQHIRSTLGGQKLAMELSDYSSRTDTRAWSHNALVDIQLCEITPAVPVRSLQEGSYLLE